MDGDPHHAGVSPIASVKTSRRHRRAFLAVRRCFEGVSRGAVGILRAYRPAVDHRIGRDLSAASEAPGNSRAARTDAHPLSDSLKSFNTLPCDQSGAAFGHSHPIEIERFLGPHEEQEPICLDIRGLEMEARKIQRR